MPVEKDILTIPEAAKYCATDRTTMWRWVKTGNLIVSITPGGHHRIVKEDLESFMREHGMYPMARKYFPRKRILIVDDDPLICKALSMAFSARKYETEVAADGFEAGIKVMQFNPDLIILDLIMPGMDGFEVCNLIKKDSKLSHIKILVLTGHDSEENKKKIMKAGADCFLVKPADEEILLKNIEGLLKPSKMRKLAG